MKINNNFLLNAMKESQKTGTTTEYLNQAIDTIANKYSIFGIWEEPEHDNYRDEMVSSAIADMNAHWRDFEVNRSYSMPFNYLTTVTCRAFFKIARQYNPDFHPYQNVV